MYPTISLSCSKTYYGSPWPWGKVQTPGLGTVALTTTPQPALEPQRTKKGGRGSCSCLCPGCLPTGNAIPSRRNTRPHRIQVTGMASSPGRHPGKGQGRCQGPLHTQKRQISHLHQPQASGSQSGLWGAPRLESSFKGFFSF